MEEDYDWKPDVVKLESELILSDDEYVDYPAGPSAETSHQILNTISANRFPIVLLERINLSKVKSCSSPSNGSSEIIMQIKVENTEDEDPLAGAVAYDEWKISPEAASSSFCKENSVAFLENLNIKTEKDPTEDNICEATTTVFCPPKSAKKTGAAVTIFRNKGVQNSATRKRIQTLKVQDRLPNIVQDRGKKNENYEAESSDGESSSSSSEQFSWMNESVPDFEKVLYMLFGEGCSFSENILKKNTRKRMNNKDTETAFQESRLLSNEQCPAKSTKRFHFKYTLTAHPEKGLFSCEQCSAQFKTKRNLIAHQLVHLSERRFSCEQCSARFKTKKNLIGHQLLHSNERRFSCEQCSSQFEAKNALKQHLFTHSAKRRFSCKQCSALFKDKGYLKKHLLTHSDLRPFSCHLCSARFKIKRILKAHLTYHSDERCFSCKQCSAKFKGRSDLNLI